VVDVPNINIYLTEEIYTYLSQRSGGHATSLAKTWIEDRYGVEIGGKK
jgi:hypothetical protein